MSRARATTKQRGYGAKHKALRRRWAREVAEGLVNCARCGGFIYPDEAWDLFGLDSSKAGGRRSYCKACDRRRGRAYYAAHREELYVQRKAAREAAWEAELEALAVEHKKRVVAARKLHAAQVRRQKEFLRSIGVPDLSPEEVAERARR